MFNQYDKSICIAIHDIYNIYMFNQYDKSIYNAIHGK